MAGQSPASDSEPLAETTAVGGNGNKVPPPPVNLAASEVVTLPGMKSGGENGHSQQAPFLGVSLPGDGHSQAESQAGSASAISSDNFFSQAQGQSLQSQATTVLGESQPQKPKGAKKKPSQLESQESGNLQIDPALLNGSASPALATPADAQVAPAANASAGVAISNAGATGGADEDAVVVKAEPKDEEEPFDVMTGAGIDLKAEQEAIAGPSRVDAPRASNTRKPTSDPTAGGLFMNIYDLSFKVHRIAFKHQLQVDPDVLNYLSLAMRHRFRNLLEVMISTSRHRNWSSHLSEPGFWPDRKGKRRRMDDEDEDQKEEEAGRERHPVFSSEIVSDPERQLAAVEKADRHQDMRAKQRRKERNEKMRAGLGDSDKAEEADAAEASLAAKRKGLTNPKHATAEVSKKLADSIANTAFGGGGSKYSWMSSGVGSLSMGPSRALAAASAGSPPATNAGETAGSRLPKPRFAPPPSTSSVAGEGSGWAAAASRLNSATEGSSGAWTDLSARRKEKEDQERLARVRVTLADALAALERERAGGAGMGSGAATLYATRALGKPPPPKRSK